MVDGHGVREEGRDGVGHAEAGAEDGDQSDVWRGGGEGLVGVAEGGLVLGFGELDQHGLDRW